MAKKIDFKQVFLDRIKQIDIDISINIRKKQWNLVKSLRNEKQQLLNQLKDMRW